jgi:outer membrane murein-binding lipoprotein Lpp
VRQESEKVINELKTMYEQELETLRSQIKDSQDKLRKEKNRVEQFLTEHDLQTWQEKVDQLETELESLKSKKLAKIEENESLFISSKEEISEIPINKSKKLDFEFENLIIQNERLKIHVDRAKMEAAQLAEELEKTRKELTETEETLKNEIKFLIGKLLKAKSKISIEGELSESARRDLYLNSIRFKQCEKPLSRQSPEKLAN